MSPLPTDLSTLASLRDEVIHLVDISPLSPAKKNALRLHIGGITDPERIADLVECRDTVQDILGSAAEERHGVQADFITRAERLQGRFERDVRTTRESRERSTDTEHAMSALAGVLS